MAKICMFNTAVAVDSAGNDFQSVIAVPPVPPSYTKPVRLFGVDKCSFEFIFTGAAGQILALYWWLEFWGDNVRVSLQAPPSLRDIPGVTPIVPWSHEVTQALDPDTGYFACEKATRETTLKVPEIFGAVGDAVWVTVEDVHAPWVRLALSTPAVPPGSNLLINAHVGGHHEDKFLIDNGDKPYVYNA